MSKEKVIVGLSGGVDSSVAAYLLQQEGYDVSALFMVNWHDYNVTLQSGCTWEDDWDMAQLVAKRLNIKIDKVDFSIPYRKHVVDYMFKEYQKGRTPNPDVLCNREIKFDLFLKEALDRGASYIATGHYVRKKTVRDNHAIIERLFMGVDDNKDQSYFLCQLSQEQLAKALFPIGHLAKSEVRALANQLKLPSAKKKDSQGICFVGKVKLPVFLQQKLSPQQGKVIRIEEDSEIFHNNENRNLEKICSPYEYTPMLGKAIGDHSGAHYYTVGQRKGLNLGGNKEPLFVIERDVKKNIIYVGEGKNHPGLYRKGLLVNEAIHWICPSFEMLPGEHKRCLVRIRYRQKTQKAELWCTEKGIYIVFEQLQRGITSGQFAVWYSFENELLGSGIIQ